MPGRELKGTAERGGGGQGLRHCISRGRGLTAWGDAKLGHSCVLSRKLTRVN